MTNVVPLHGRCKCGSVSTESVDVVYRGDKIGAITACRSCIERVQGELDEVRPVFDAMIRAGVPRDIANDTMSYLLGRLHP